MNKVSELSDDLEAVSVVLGELKRELRTHRRFMALRVHLWVKFNSIIVQIPCPAILFAHFHLY